MQDRDTLMDLLRAVRAEWPHDHRLGALVAMVESGELSRAEVAAVLPEAAARQTAYLRCVQTCLMDHELTEEEIVALGFLRTALDIDEGELFEERRDAVQRIVSEVMYVILADLDTSRDESRLKDGLQRSLGLGYDEFAELGSQPMHEAFTRILEELDPENRGLSDEGFAEFSRRAVRLESTFPLSSGADSDPHRRHIPQHVKDAVWRRDEGRCVSCRSQTRLEFDHIIPYSKGGASTYRNVQLLCESCNRGKSDRIG